jgi:autotransporter-associated beta strand protein
MAQSATAPRNDRPTARSRRPAILATSIAALTALCFFPQGARAQTWVGGTSSDWNTATNWTNPASVPVTTATFDASSVTGVSISVATGVGGITFDANATSTYTITINSPGSLSITGVGIMNSSGVAQDFAVGVDGSGNFGTLTFSGSATAGSDIQITADGATLSGATGAQTIFQGTSSAGSAILITQGGSNGGLGGATLFKGSADGGTAAATTNGNGTFDISYLTTGGMNIGSIAGSGSYLLGSKTLTVGGNNQNTTVSGVIADGGQGGGTGGSLVKVGTGTLTLTGANTYTGATTVTGGTLQIGNTIGGAGSIGSAAVSVQSGGTFSLVNLTGGVLANNISNGVSGLGTVLVNSGNLNTLSGVLSDGTAGQLALTQSGSGQTILTNNETYTGATTVTNGTLQIGTTTGAGSLNSVTAVSVTSGGTLSLLNVTGNTFANAVSNGVSGVGTLNFAVPGTASTLTVSGALTDAAPGQLAVSQTGGATTILTNSGNTYSGATTVSSGTLQIGNTGTAGSIGANSAISIGTGGTLSVVNITGNALGNNVTNGISSPTADVGTLQFNAAGTLTVSGTLTDGSSGHQLALSQVGSGTTILTNTGNTYSGATTISGGILQVGTTGAAGSLGPQSSVAVSNGGSLALVNVSGGTLSNPITNGTIGLGTVNVNSTGTITLSGALTDGITGQIALTQAGGGTTILANSANSYSGATTVSMGTLQIGSATHNGSLGSSSAVSVSNGATLSLVNYAGSSVPNSITNGVNGLGTLNINSASSLTLSGNLTDGTAGQLTVTQTGSASTTLTGIGNAYTGGTTISAGQLQIGNSSNAGSIGSGTVTVSGSGTFAVANLSGNTLANSVTNGVSGTGTIDFNSTNPNSVLTVSGTLTDGTAGTLALTESGAATTTTILTNAMNAYSGATTVNVGTLQIGTAGKAGSIGANSAVSINTGGTLSVVNLSGGTLANNIDNGVTNTGTLNIDSTTAVTLSGTLTNGSAGTLALTQSGAGTTTITNSGNNFSGATAVTAGILQIGTTNSAGSIGIASPVTITSGASLDLVNVSTNTFANSVSNGASGVGTLNIDTGNTLTLSGALTNGTSGTLALTQSGAGTTILTNSGNTFSGATTVSLGTLQLGTSSVSGSLGPTSAVSVSNGGALTVINVNGNVLENNITNGVSGLGTVTINSSLKTSVSGTLSDGAAGQLALTQSGPGTTILSGTNTYTGATTVNAGTLLVNGSIAAGSTVTVNSSGALGGTGTIKGTANILSGGSFQPGPSATAGGTLTVGNLVLNSGSTTTFGLAVAGVVGGANDLVNVTGNLTLGGTLNVTPLSGFGIGSYTLFNYGGTLAGSFGSTIGGLSAYTTAISTAIAGEVILTVSNGNAQYWDGALTTGNGTIAGGTGNWNATTTNWTTVSGTPNSVWGGSGQNPSFGTAVFQGTAGTITLTSPISAQGLIFGVDGYTLAGTSSNKLTLIGTSPDISVTNAGTTATISAGLAGTAGLSVNGAGTLVLTNSANTYTGGTKIGGGTVQVGSVVGSTATAGSLGSGAVSIYDGGTLLLKDVTGNAFSANVSNTVGGVGALNVQSTLTNTISGTLTDGSPGSLALTQSGAGTTILTNAANTYTGATTVSAGTLQIGTASLAGSIGATSAISIGSGGTLLFLKAGTTTYGNSVTNGLGGTGTLNLDSTAGLTFSGVLSDGMGKLSVTQSGAGTTILSGSDSYTGATNVTAGTLQIGNGSSGNLAGGSVVTVTNSGILALDLGNSVTFANNVGLSGSSASLKITGSSSSETLTGIISGAGSLAQTGAATTILTGLNTYTGTTKVSAGTLQVGTSTQAASIGTGALSVGAGASLILSNVHGNSLANSASNGVGGVGTLNVDSTNTNTLSGALTDGSTGQLALTQSGAGTTILTNGANTFSGATSITSGILEIGTTATAGSLGAKSAVGIGGTATLDLVNGTGNTLANAVTAGSSGVGTLEINSANINTISGALIDGSGGGQLSLSQKGAGTTILTNSGNTFSGATNVGDGTLQIGTTSVAGSIGSTSAISISPGAILSVVNANSNALANNISTTTSGTGTVVMNSANTITLSGTLSDTTPGTLALTQNGKGTTIISGTDSYSGATTVAAGKLLVNGSLGSSSAVTVDSGATLGGAGTINGIITVNAGGNFNPGGNTAPGTLSTSSLILNSGTTTTFRLAQSGKIGGGVNDEVVVGASTTLTLAGTLNISPLGGFGIGNYTLMTYGGNQSGSFASITGLKGYTDALSYGSGTVSLLVTLGAAQYWDGAGTANDSVVSGGTGNWNTTSNNWTNASGSVNSTWGGGTAIFGATAGTVTLTSAISAQGLIFNTTGYVLTSTAAADTLTLAGTAAQISVTGAGNTATISAPIAGTGSLTANGVGTLILTNATNSYKGGTIVANGTVQVGSGSTAGSVGSGAVTVSSGGTLSLVELTGPTFSATVSNGLGGTGTLLINSTNNVTLSGALTNGSAGTLALTQSGTGTTILASGGNSYTGTTTVGGGTLQVGTTTAAGLIAAGSAINLGSSSSGTSTLSLVNVSGGTFGASVNNTLGGTGQITVNTTGNITLSGVISGSASDVLQFTQAGTGTTILTGANTYDGTTTVNAGTLQVGNGSVGNLGSNSAVTVANSATLAIDVANSASFSNNVTLSSSTSTLKILGANVVTLAGVISGSGVVIQSGSGTTTLSGSETYTGATSVNAGILVVGNGSTGGLTGTGLITVANGAILGANLPAGGSFTPNVKLNGSTATFIVGGSTSNTYSNIISGTGVFDQNGSGTTTLGVAETFTGTTNVNAGTLQINGSLPAGNTVNVTTGGTLSGSGTIGGNTTLTGNGAINFAPGATINGTLALTGGNWYGVGTVKGAVNLTSGVFTLTNDLTASAGMTVSGGTLAGSGTLTGNLNYTAGSGQEFDGAIAGTGSTLTVAGNSTFTMVGFSSYTGATTVTSGTLQIGNGFTGNVANTSGITVGGGASLLLNLPAGTVFTSPIVDNGQVNASGTQSNNYTISSLISGTGSLVASSDTTVIVTGKSTFTGPTTVTAGTLQLGDGVTAGAALGSGTVTVSNGGTLALNLVGGESFSNKLTDNGQVMLAGANNYTVASPISGTGNLAASGTGTVTISGANTYTGGTQLNSGELSLGSAGALGSTGSISFTGGTLQYTAANTTDYSSRFSAASGQAYSIDTNGQNVTFAKALTSSTGSLVKLGAGTLSLSAASTYSGATTIDAGTLNLAFGASVTSNILPSTASVDLAGGTLSLTGGTSTSSVNQTFHNIQARPDTASAILLGSAFQTLTTGSIGFSVGSALNLNTTAGGANATTSTVGSATLVIPGEIAGVIIQPSFTVTDAGGFGLAVGNANHQIVRLSPGSATLLPASGATVVGNFLVNSSLAVTATESANSITVDTTSGTGTLTLASNVVLSSFIWNFGGNGANAYTIAPANGATGVALESPGASAPMYFNNYNSGSVTISAPILDNSTTAVVFGGPGTTVLAGTNTYAGGTTISSGATLQIGSGGSSGSIAGNVVNNGTLVLDRSGALALSGVISGSGGLTQSGAGTAILTGANTYTGGTLVSAGTLQLGDGTTAGASLAGSNLTITSTGTLALDLVTGESFPNSVTNNGQLTTIGASSFTISGIIRGTGSLTAAGTGTVTITGANTFSGGATISSGTLQIGDGVTLGSTLGTGSVGINSGATLTLDLVTGESFSNRTTDTGHLVASGANNYTVSAIISGAGDFTANNSGIVNLTGANTFSGGVNLNAGELSLGNAGAIGSSGTISFAGGTLQFTSANTTDYSARFSTASGHEAYSIDTNGQKVTFATALTGSGGSLTKFGAGTLTLSAANTFGGATTVNAGTLDLAAQNALQNSTLSLNGGGVTFDSVVSGNAFSLGGIAGNGNIALTNTASKAIALTVGGNNSSNTYPGVFSGAGSLTNTGTGTLTLTGASTFTGGTSISSGTVILGNGSTTGAALGAGNVTINSGATFTVDLANGETFSNAVTDNGHLTTAGTSNNFTVASTISGTGTFSNTGSNAVTLTGPNTYSGGTNVSSGDLTLGNGTASHAALGSGSVNINSGATLTVDLANGETFSNNVTDAGQLTTTGTTNNFTVSATVSGIGNLTDTGTNTVTLTGPNSYSGGTNISGGNLVLGNGTTAHAAVGSGNVTVGSGATFTVNLANGETLTNNVGDNGLFIATGTTNNFTVASTVSGTGNISKTGSNTVTLTGANTYSGSTTISGGTLLAKNTSGSATGTGAVTINSGGTFGGSGTVSGAMTLNSGGTLNPGAGSSGTPGTTLHGSSLTWNGGSTLTLQAGPSAADALALTGALTKGSSGTFTINLVDVGLTTTAVNYTLVTFASTTFSLANFTLDLPANVTGTLVETATSLEIQNLKDPPAVTSGNVEAGGATLTISSGISSGTGNDGEILYSSGSTVSGTTISAGSSAGILTIGSAVSGTTISAGSNAGILTIGSADILGESAATSSSATLNVDDTNLVLDSGTVEVDGANLTLAAGGTNSLELGNVNIVATPEPGSAVLLAFGGAALLGWRRRRRG